MIENMDTVSKERPLVTFALFTYNQQEYIREAIEGAFSQTYEPLEIILSDDCSSDSTFEIMQTMAAEYQGPHRILIRQNESNRGLIGHLNDVLACASGEIISWAAGDDIALPNRTSEFAEVLSKNRKCIAVHSSVQEIDLRSETIKIRSDTAGQNGYSLKDVVEELKSMVSQSHAFHRVAFDTFGPFQPYLTHEGYAMTFREAALGEIIYINKPLTKYRIGSGVSTYSGQDLQALKFSEPRKISEWYYTSAMQILDDIRAKPELFDRKIKVAAEQNFYFYRNLFYINSGKSWFSPIVRNFCSRPTDMRGVRAIVRRMLPMKIYAKFKFS